MSFFGRTVTIEAFGTDLKTPIITPQTAIVGDQEEFSDLAQYDIPGDMFQTVNGDFNITENTITYTADEEFFTQFADVEDFNGIVMTFDLGDKRIADAALVIDDFNRPAENLFFNANSVFLDFDGLPFQNGDMGRVDVTFLDTADPVLTDGSLNEDNASFTARLYAAAFGREPDQPGLNFWIDVFNDVGRVGMSELFLTSPEFGDRFGDPVSLTDSGYLDLLYNNILGRDGDAPGTAFWLDVLTNDLASRAEVLSFFADSEENVTNTPELENLAVASGSGDWFLLT